MLCGFTTMIESVPALAMSVARICAEILVALDVLVERGLPFHSSTESDVKFVPVTISVKFPPPATDVAGETEVIVGAASLTTKFTAPDVALPAPELATVMANVPALVRSVAGICARSAELLTKVVGRILPFHCTVEVDVKFAPSTFIVNAGPPCTPVAGEMAQIKGTPVPETANETLGEKLNPPTPFGVYTFTLS